MLYWDLYYNLDGCPFNKWFHSSFIFVSKAWFHLDIKDSPGIGMASWAELQANYLLMPLTFDTHAFEALVLDLNRKLEPISISLHKGAYLRRDRDKQAFEHTVSDIRERKNFISQKCEFYKTVLANLQCHVVTDHRGKRNYSYDLLLCKALYEKLAPTYDYDIRDNWRYLDYLVWDILDECKKLLDMLRFCGVETLPDVVMPYASDKEALTDSLRSYMQQLNDTKKRRTRDFIQNVEGVMRNARVEYEDTKKKLLTVFQFRDGQVADRYRYVEEYGDKPLTFKKVTRGATSEMALRQIGVDNPHTELLGLLASLNEGMTTDIREIEVRIWDEIDSGVTETCVIRLERGQSLCDILERKRALMYWYQVYSIDLHLSPLLNWRPRESTPEQTRFMVNNWGENLFNTLNRRHYLKLHLDRSVQVISRAGGARRGVPTSARPPRGE